MTSMINIPDEVHFSKNNNMVVKTSVMGQTITKNFSTMKMSHLRIRYGEYASIGLLPRSFCLCFLSMQESSFKVFVLMSNDLLAGVEYENSETSPWHSGRFFKCLFMPGYHEPIEPLALRRGFSSSRNYISCIGYLWSYQLMMMGSGEESKRVESGIIMLAGKGPGSGTFLS